MKTRRVAAKKLKLWKFRDKIPFGKSIDHAMIVDMQDEIESSWNIKFQARFKARYPPKIRTMIGFVVASILSRKGGNVGVYAGIPILARGNERVLPVIEEGLKNEHPEIRRYSALALGLAGHASALDPLHDFIDDPEAEHSIVATALGEIASLDSVEPLRRIIESPKFSKAARAAALVSLGEIGGPAAEEPLIKYAISNDGEMRTGAIEGLALLREQHDDQIVEGLLKCKTKRSIAIGVVSLGRVTGEYSTEVLCRYALNCPFVDIRTIAVLSLGQKPTEEVLATLEKVIDTDEEAVVRRAAVTAWKYLDVPESAVFDIALENDPEDGVRVAIALALALKGNPIGKSYLIPFLEGGEQDPQVAEIIVAIGRLGLKEAIPILKEFLDAQPLRTNRNQAYVTLLLLGEDKYREKLTQLVSEEEAPYASLPCYELARVGDKEGLKQMQQEILNGFLMPRREWLAGNSSFIDEKFTDTVVETLKTTLKEDIATRVREAATYSLGRLGGHDEFLREVSESDASNRTCRVAKAMLSKK